MKNNNQMNEDQLESLMQAANVLKVMSNPSRLKILCYLEEGCLTVNELTERIGKGQSAISQHLKVLREADLVTFNREHNKLHYLLKNSEVTQIISLLRKLYCSQ